jgi:hypothetical protein
MVTRPVVATPTPRVLPFLGLVTVKFAPAVAPPVLVKVTVGPPLICMLLDRAMIPAASVPEPVHTAPAQPGTSSRTLVPVTCAHTVVFWVTARARARLSTPASSSAPAPSDEVCQYLSRLGTLKIASRAMSPSTTISSVSPNPR